MTSPASPDLLAAVGALRDADQGYRKAAAYYSGDIAEVFASVRLRRAIMRTGVGFVFNFARMPVDALAERVALAAVTATPDSANTTLAQVWKHNKMRRTAKQFHRRAFEYGDSYALVWPNEDDPTQVDIFYNSPRSVRLFYDGENPRKKAFAIKQWQMPDKSTRVDLFYPDRIEKYRKVRSPGASQGVWQEWTDDPGDQWPYPNPFGEIPVFHFRTDEPYGTPEHRGFYGPQDAIHKLIISHMSGVDYQAFPQRWALRDTDSDTSEASATDEDEFAFGSDTGATQPDTEGRSQFTADPGSIWEMQGFKGVGQFDTADHNNFTEPMLVYLRFGAQVTNTPLFRIDPTGSIPSGESRKVAEAPFVAKAEDRQDSFEDTWEELVTFALKVAGSPAQSVDIQWQPTQSSDDLASWQTLTAKLSAGLPAHQAFLEAGYSAEQIKEWFPDDVDLKAAAELLLLICQALAAGGTAVSLGAVSDPQIQALIAKLIGDPDGDGVADIMDADDAGPKAIEVGTANEERVAPQPPPVPGGGSVAAA